MMEGGVFVRAARPHESSGIVCEDSAHVVTEDHAAFGCVSDGCSSGIESSLSSRVLSKAASHFWEKEPHLWGEALGRKAWEAVITACHCCGMDAKKSPATLLMLTLEIEESNVVEDESIQDEKSNASKFFNLKGQLWGDGALAISSENGELLELWIGESNDNMPAYPAYAFDEELWKEFKIQEGRSFWRKTYSKNENESLCVFKEHERSWTLSAVLKEKMAVYLMTDGLTAIEGVGVIESAKALCSGKGPGEFWLRRARKAIDDWERQGKKLGDDLGLMCLKAI